MESKDIIETMKADKPVVYNGSVYKKILEYILWFDSSKVEHKSVVLLDKNGSTTVRVDANRIASSGVIENEM